MTTWSNSNAEITLARRYDLHLARKLWHIFAGVTGLTTYYSLKLSPEVTASALLLIGLLGLCVDLARLRLEKVNQWALKLMGPFMRESERHGLSGLPFYAFGVSLSLYFFPEKLAILGILFLIFADPIASFVGILYGTRKVIGSKSFEGMYAAFATCFALSLVYGLYYAELSYDIVLFSLFAGMIGSAAEALSTKVDDNLTIPLVSGAGLWALNLFVPVF